MNDDAFELSGGPPKPLSVKEETRFMVEKALRYASLPGPPQPRPSGWAALYLFDLR